MSWKNGSRAREICRRRLQVIHVSDCKGWSSGCAIQDGEEGMKMNDIREGEWTGLGDELTVGDWVMGKLPGLLTRTLDRWSRHLLRGEIDFDCSTLKMVGLRVLSGSPCAENQ